MQNIKDKDRGKERKKPASVVTAKKCNLFRPEKSLSIDVSWIPKTERKCAISEMFLIELLTGADANQTTFQKKKSAKEMV